MCEHHTTPSDLSRSITCRAVNEQASENMLDLVSLDRGERTQRAERILTKGKEHKEGRRNVNQGRCDLEKLYINSAFLQRIDYCNDHIKRSIFGIKKAKEALGTLSHGRRT